MLKRLPRILGLRDRLQGWSVVYCLKASDSINLQRHVAHKLIDEKSRKRLKLICELSYDYLYFNVYIDSSNVLPDFYLSDFQDITYYKDFITALAVHSSLSVTITPSTHCRQHNAFLNGIEI
ncbi:hypothetical protein LguiA_021709 [Lonicera macranthoides]